MNKTVLRVSVISLLIILVGIAPAFAESKGTIGVVSASQKNPYFATLSENAKKVFENAGYSVIVADAEWNSVKESNTLDNFISRGVEGIVLCPTDSHALASAVNRVSDAGIPLITADMAVYGADYVATVESDNYNAGYVVGKFVNTFYSNLKEEGKREPPFKIICGVAPQNNSCVARQKGFEDALKEGPEGLVEIKDKMIIGGFDMETGYSKTQGILAANKDLDALYFGCNDLVGLGALQALQAANRDQVEIFAVDGQPEAIKAINKGTAFKSTGAQYPNVIGYMAANQLLKVLNGKNVPSYIKVKTKAIHLPLEPWSIDPAKATEEMDMVSRIIDVEFPIEEPVK